MNNEKRSNRILHFQEVNNLMEEQLEKWNSIAEIRKTYDEFIRNLKKLKDLQPDLEKNLEPLQDDLRAKQEQLIEKIFPVTNILAVYGADHKLKKSVRTLITGQAELQKMKKGKLLTFAGRLLKTTEKLFPDPQKLDSELMQYGLTAVMVEEFRTALTKYTHAWRLYMDLKCNRTQSKKLSNRLLKANQELLEKRLDRLMTVFSVTHPSFFQDYTKTREPKVK